MTVATSAPPADAGAGAHEEIIDADVVGSGDEPTHGMALDRVTTATAIIRADEPEQILVKAAKIADSLKGLIEQQGLAIDVGGGKKHVEVNGWQALGALLGALGGEALHAETIWTKRVLDPDGQPVRHQYTAIVKRYHSKAQGGGLKSETTYDVDGFDWEACVEIRTPGGVTVGRAEAMCSRAEAQWGRSDDYAVRSMAETRAESRAYRRAAGWLVAIAGYNPTPAEEMGGVRRDDDQAAAAPAAQEQAPKFGKAVNNDQLRKVRGALGYLMDLSEGDERVTLVLRAIAQAAGGYLPQIAVAAVVMTAKAIQIKREGDVQAEDERPEAADPVQSGDAEERPAAGTVELTAEQLADPQALADAGCTCSPDDGKDDDCPIKGHGIPF